MLRRDGVAVIDVRVVVIRMTEGFRVTLGCGSVPGCDLVRIDVVVVVSVAARNQVVQATLPNDGGDVKNGGGRYGAGVTAEM